jgi:hypothetical protein
MTSKVHCDEAQLVAESGAQLTAPGQPALRKAVDEQHRATPIVAGFRHVDFGATSTLYVMVSCRGVSGFKLTGHGISFCLLLSYPLPKS